MDRFCCSARVPSLGTLKLSSFSSMTQADHAEVRGCPFSIAERLVERTRSAVIKVTFRYATASGKLGLPRSAATPLIWADAEHAGMPAKTVFITERVCPLGEREMNSSLTGP